MTALEQAAQELQLVREKHRQISDDLIKAEDLVAELRQQKGKAMQEIMLAEEKLLRAAR